MTSVLAENRILVNHDRAKALTPGGRPCEEIVVETLPERLRSILEALGISARELSRRAGLKSESHVGAAIDGRFQLKVETIEAIARVAGVRFEWLATGRGRRDVGPEELDPYEAARVAFLAQETYEGRRDVASAFLAHRDANMASAGAEDHAPDWWLATLREEFRRWEQPGELPEGNPRPRGFSKLPQRR